MWQQWANGILGLWVLIVPFLNLAPETFQWTLAISGILIAIMGFWGATEHLSSPGQRMRTV